MNRESAEKAAREFVDTLNFCGPTQAAAQAIVETHVRNLADIIERAGGEDGLLEWAVGRWKAEVENRPLVNVHRRTLDDTWRQVIRYAGGDPVELVGTDHDTRLALNPVKPAGERPCGETARVSVDRLKNMIAFWRISYQEKKDAENHESADICETVVGVLESLLPSPPTAEGR